VKRDSDSRTAAEHVKKQEETQTHEDNEARKLVDRIEKKVKDQEVAVPKRNLRVVKSVGTPSPLWESAPFAIANSRFPWSQ